MAFDMVAPPDFDATLAGASRAAIEISAVADIPKIRLDSLKEAALTFGVRSGLARRSYEISKVLHDNQTLLDSVFNFNSLLLEKNVLPPVLTEAENELRQPNGETILIAAVTYRIKKQAVFVTAPPTWREYLIRDQREHKAELPADILLPKGDAEKKIWQQSVTFGWQTGVRQADSIFEQSLARLEGEMKGMILYRSLLAKGMIGRPYVAEAKLGVTGDGNTMSIDHRILRITAKPQLELNAGLWKPIATPK